MKEEKKTESNSENNSLEYFLGVILLGLGIFMLFKKTVVHSSWHTWTIFGTDFSTGLVILPFIIGVIWYFYNSESIIPKILIALGVVIIIATIIMSVRITLSTMSLWDYILIIGMSASGAGLLLKNVFKKRKQ